MLHPDYQYDATRIPDLIAPILAGERDLMLGSRFLGDPLAGGMPRWKFVLDPDSRFCSRSRYTLLRSSNGEQASMSEQPAPKPKP